MFAGIGRGEESRDTMKKREEEVKGFKKNHRYTQTLIADMLTVQWKIVSQGLSSVKRLSLHSILLFDIPETELHPKPGEIRPPCFYVLVDGSQYDCHKCHVLKS